MLTGERVHLRALEPADSEPMWRWYHDPEVGRWMETAPPISLAQNMKRGEERPRNTFEQMLLAVETLDERKFIGYAALGDTNFVSGEITLESFALGERDHWGAGYATDALRVICRYAFEEIGLNRVMLWVVAENAAAVRLYERVGFVVEGRRREAFRSGGRRYDYLMMGLLAHELR
ncbi:GNAT family N-acetyltransferase [Microtetraspora malaysiensis]|uniref:GNAT family N-acetyltransferase n=1 Tax=Microtetraspora malaysiensis TaxID=161358 RepID=A0ABW6SMH6_9ACTN